MSRVGMMAMIAGALSMYAQYDSSDFMYLPSLSTPTPKPRKGVGSAFTKGKRHRSQRSRANRRK